MTDKNRVDLYSLIHKAQRVRLFALSTKIAKADLENSAELAVIKQELEAIIKHLKSPRYSRNYFRSSAVRRSEQSR